MDDRRERPRCHHPTAGDSRERGGTGLQPWLQQGRRDFLVRPGRGGRQLRPAATPGAAHRQRGFCRQVGDLDGYRQRSSPGKGPRGIRERRDHRTAVYHESGSKEASRKGVRQRGSTQLKRGSSQLESGSTQLKRRSTQLERGSTGPGGLIGSAEHDYLAAVGWQPARHPGRRPQLESGRQRRRPVPHARPAARHELRPVGSRSSSGSRSSRGPKGAHQPRRQHVGTLPRHHRRRPPASRRGHTRTGLRPSGNPPDNPPPPPQRG